VALCVKSTEAICKGVRPAANAFTFSVTLSHRVGCVEAGLQMMEKICLEEIKPIRLCGQVSFDWLLAFHFLHPN
jgi:hypothetical protein